MSNHTIYYSEIKNFKGYPKDVGLDSHKGERSDIN